MTDTLQITIKFFGAFKQFKQYFNDANDFTFQLKNPCTIADVRCEFNQQLKMHCPDYKEELLNHSLFADNDSILPETTTIKTSTELCIIPPVSGG